jgi:hypothetical protein
MTVNVMSNKSSGVLLVSRLSLLLFALAGLGARPARAQTCLPLNESTFVTTFGAQVAIASSDDSVIAAWQATDKSQSNTQTIVVQGLVGPNLCPAATVDGMTPLLRGVSTTKHPVSSPAVAFSSNGPPGTEFFLVWQDNPSGTNGDIWGVFLTSDGKLVAPAFHINNDSDNETTPTVVWSPRVGKFLVTYRRTHGSTTAITANWVTTGQQVSGKQDIIASGVNTGGTKPTVSLISPNEAVLVTYNDNKYEFVNEVTLALNEPTIAISGATGIQAIANVDLESFGLAWNTGTGSSMQIMSKTFPNGCLESWCADAAVAIITNGYGNGLTNPVISPFGGGYAIYSAYLPTSWQYLGAAVVDETGAFVESDAAMVPNCSGGLKSGYSWGTPTTMAATAASSSDLSLLLFDAECATAGYPFEWVMATPPSNFYGFFATAVSK